MKNKDNAQKYTNIATIFSATIALIALLISMKSCTDSGKALRNASEANRLSAEANKLSKQSNILSEESTERVRGNIPAIIHVDPFEDNITLASIEDLKKTHIGMMIHNIGNNSIDMVRMQVFSIFKWRDYKELRFNRPQENTHDQIDLTLAEHVRPGGRTIADLTTTILKQLVGLDFGNGGKVHTAMFNIKCTGRPVGYSLPTGVGLDLIQA